MDNYTPKHLRLWTRPDSYMGASWPDTYSAGFGQSRDSDALERSNFAVAWEVVRGASEAAEVVRESHWAVGWVEWIAIPADETLALRVADALCARAADYPVLDEEHFATLEAADANDVWRDAYSPAERVAYIRDHRDQFNFRDLADMLGCVRGQYFAGYASELLS